jgi:GT2 family glycosyltransferase
VSLAHAPKVGVAVVHWRGMDDTRECLESLAGLTYPDAEIVVAVNGREDFDEGIARAACPRLRVLRLQTNAGYAAACNAAARDVFAASARYVMLLNNDTIVAPGTLDRLIAACTGDRGVGICGPVVMYYDEPSRVWSAGGYVNTTLGYTRHHGFDSEELPEAGRRVDFVSGCAMLVTREAWERLGGMDERYFHYFEDADLCARARNVGYASYVVPAPLVRHKVSASAGSRGSNRLNRQQAYYFSRNRYRFLRRNVGGARLFCALCCQALLLLPREGYRDLRERNLEAPAGRISGLYDALRGRSGPRGRE